MSHTHTHSHTPTHTCYYKQCFFIHSGMCDRWSSVSPCQRTHWVRDQTTDSLISERTSWSTTAVHMSWNKLDDLEMTLNINIHNGLDISTSTVLSSWWMESYNPCAIMSSDSQEQIWTPLYPVIKESIRSKCVKHWHTTMLCHNCLYVLTELYCV